MLNFAQFKTLVVSAFWAGLWAGLLLTVIQSFQVIPTLLQAEVFESRASLALSSLHASMEPQLAETEAWQPGNGLERSIFTAVANISLAIGFALLIGAASNLKGGIPHWRNGLWWGLAGYGIFFVAPALGLPPEVPGTQAAELESRQLWWMMAVSDTAGGLWLLVFAQTRINKGLGTLLLIVPHLIGAPHPDIHGAAAPAALAQSFITATTLTNAIFWLSLGALMGLNLSKHRH